MKQIGQFVFSLLGDVRVTVVHLIGEGNLVGSRISANAKRKSDGEPVSWSENHFYQVEDGKIVEWWGEGAPPLQ